jgi:tetratricopeptide (TPR) repeat protein
MTRRNRDRNLPPSATKQNALPTSQRKQRWAMLGLVVLVAGGAMGVWWWSRPVVAPSPVPPMPDDIGDSEVILAVERARKDVLAKPESDAAWGNLGMTFMANDCAEAADRCFEEAARLEPTEPKWPYYRAMSVLERDIEKTVPFLRQAERAAGSRPTYRKLVRLRLAEALLQKEELDEAEGFFLAAMDAAPDDSRASYGLGLIALRRREETAATKYLTVAATRQSHAQKRATTMLAYLARSRGDVAAASGYEQTLLALPNDPPWPDFLMDQVYALQAGQRSRWRYVAQLEWQGDFAGAARASLAELERRPTPDGFISAGTNLGRIGEFDKALSLLRKAVRFDPENANASYALAVTLFNRAESDWHNKPNSPLAVECYRQAIPLARRATELTPGYSQAYLVWGQSLRRLGQPAAAVIPLRTGVSGRPQDFLLQLALGEALLEAESYAEAETFLKNARELEPKDERPIQALARLYRKKS